MPELLNNPALRLRALAAALIVLLVGLGRYAGSEAPGRFPIEGAQAAAALVAANLPVAGAEVSLLARMTATSHDPQFAVAAIEPWGDRAAHVRIICTVHEQCLPFYIAVRWPDVSSARQAMLSAGVTAQTIDRAEALGHSAAGTMSSAVAQPAALPISRTQLPAAVATPPGHFLDGSAANTRDLTRSGALRAGARATLVMDGERLHIQVPVICLENGEPGRTIRVTGLDHKQTYFAQVVDGTQLKGTL